MHLRPYKQSSRLLKSEERPCRNGEDSVRQLTSLLPAMLMSSCFRRSPLCWSWLPARPPGAPACSPRPLRCRRSASCLPLCMHIAAFKLYQINGLVRHYNLMHQPKKALISSDTLSHQKPAPDWGAHVRSLQFIRRAMLRIQLLFCCGLLRETS